MLLDRPCSTSIAVRWRSFVSAPNLQQDSWPHMLSILEILQKCDAAGQYRRAPDKFVATMSKIPGYEGVRDVMMF